MNSSEIKEKFSKILRNSEYIRVSDTHPLDLYLGKNEKGYLTLRYNGVFNPVKIFSRGLLEIKQVKLDSYDSILFCFTSIEDPSLFYSFCEDIINRTMEYKGKDGYIEIINRYNQWKKMFQQGKYKLLSENEILGLIGELLFLKEYSFEKYGQTNGLNGWSGPEPTHKDFSYNNEWFEIKSINSFRNAVRISSIEQLDSEYPGMLVIYSFEKMSSNFKGISLNALVKSIYDMLEYSSDKDVFEEKLKLVGYINNEYYDSYVYNLIKREMYRVDETFPKITASSLPFGVCKVEYEIQISLIEKYKED